MSMKEEKPESETMSEEEFDEAYEKYVEDRWENTGKTHERLVQCVGCGAKYECNENVLCEGKKCDVCGQELKF